MNTSECNIESLFDGMDLVSNLSRPRFDTLIQNDLNKMKDAIQKFICKHSDITINRVVLAGGTCKVPKVQSVIGQLFPNSSIINSSPDEVIAMGTASHADMIGKHPSLSSKTESEPDGTVSIPLCPTDIGVKVGDTVTPAIPKDTPLPCCLLYTSPSPRD